MNPEPRPAVLDTRLPELPARKACTCREGVLCLHARPEAGRFVYVCSRCSREERVDLAERRSRHSPWPRERPARPPINRSIILTDPEHDALARGRD